MPIQSGGIADWKSELSRPNSRFLLMHTAVGLHWCSNLVESVQMCIDTQGSWPRGDDWNEHDQFAGSEGTLWTPSYCGLGLIQARLMLRDIPKVESFVPGSTHILI
jgi:hypothetical protein